VQVHYVYQLPVVQDQVVLIQYIAAAPEDDQDQEHPHHLQVVQVEVAVEQDQELQAAAQHLRPARLVQPFPQKVWEEQEALVILGHLTLQHMVAVEVVEYLRDILRLLYLDQVDLVEGDKVEFH
jgi:hypothetical protein